MKQGRSGTKPLVEMSQSRLSRRAFLQQTVVLGLTSSTIGVLGGRTAFAATAKSFAGKTLHVQFWSGPEGDNIQRNVVEPFKEETGAEVIVDYGFTSGSIAKIRAQKNSPQLDVVLMDDIGVVTVAPEGLLQPLDLSKIPNAADVDPRFVIANSMGIGFFTYVDTLLFNTQAYPQPPTTWRELWSDKLRNKVAVPSSNQTPALHMVIVAARLAGGDQHNPDPGFELLGKLKPNVHSFAENTAQMAELLKSRDIELLGWTSYIFKEYMDKGYPIENTFAVKEGVFATPACAAIPKGHPGPQELAELFVNKCLDAKAQEGMAKGLWFGPTNRKANIPPEVAKRVITFEALNNTIPVDLDHLLQVRADWIVRYEKALRG
jgi:putative spermidine/putrescine transport system substrate-binding protein